MITEKETLHQSFMNILEEARLVFPGTQTLFGFQLIVVFTDFFQKNFTMDLKLIHFISTTLTFLSFSIILTLTAYHRHLNSDLLTKNLVSVSNKIIKSGMIPLMIALSLDFFLISYFTFGDKIISAIFAIIAFLVIFTLWYLIPKSGIVIGIADS